jgi:hypothetical protein
MAATENSPALQLSSGARLRQPHDANARHGCPSAHQRHYHKRQHVNDPGHHGPPAGAVLAPIRAAWNGPHRASPSLPGAGRVWVPPPATQARTPKRPAPAVAPTPAATTISST